MIEVSEIEKVISILESKIVKVPNELHSGWNNALKTSIQYLKGLLPK